MCACPAASQYHGGGIYNRGGTLTLTHSPVTNNTAVVRRCPPTEHPRLRVLDVAVA